MSCSCPGSELLETLVKFKPDEEEIAVHLITVEDEFEGDQQRDHLDQLSESCRGVGIAFTWEVDTTGNLQTQHIVTDHGWKIVLDRGLDIYQPYGVNGDFAFANRLQQFRPCKAFTVTYSKTDDIILRQP
jgi:ATP-dependent Lon protease